MSNISPCVDIAFKKIFGVEENKDLLISLINSVLAPEDAVGEVTLLNPYNINSYKDDKLSIMDIKAISKDGRRFNIEMQITNEADYDKRALYYWAQLYHEQLKSSKDYSSLNKAIGIHILNFSTIRESDRYHNVFHVTEKEDGFRYFHDFEVHTIELDKFEGNSSADYQSLLSKIKTALDAWVAFLTKHDVLAQHKLNKQLEEVGVEKAINVLDVMHLSEVEKNAYEDHLKFLRVEMNALKKQHMLGHAEGLIEGRMEGIEEGLEKGELRAKKMMVQTMLESGLSLEQISEFTRIPMHEITKFRE